MGELIVLEGLDGSGKATQAKLLYEALLHQSVRVRQVDFPNYSSPSSALVKMYLGGEFGTHPNDVNPYAASSFYSVDRYASYKKDWGQFYHSGGVVVSDRYTTSNAVHQCSKLPQDEWDHFLQWLFQFEYEQLGIPKPNLVLYLDMDLAVSQQLIAQRYAGDESKKDIHEKDVEYLSRSGASAHYCADKLGWKRIACCNNGALRPIEAIHEDIMSAVKELNFTDAKEYNHA